MSTRRFTSNTVPARLDPLEARVMLANTLTFADVDNDQVTVKLTGPGTVAAVLSDGGSGFISSLNLTGTTGASALSVSVRKNAAGNGRIRVDNISDAFLGKLSAATADIQVTANIELGDIASFAFGDTSADVLFTLAPPTGKNLNAAFRNLSGTVEVIGAVSTFIVQNSSSSAVVHTGAMRTLKAVENLAGNWLADNYGSVTVGEDTAASIRASIPNAQGYSWGSIRTGSASNLTLDADGNNIFGRVKSISIFSDWTSGDVNALGIDSLRVTNNCGIDSLRLWGQDPAKFAIKSARVGGIVSGGWNFAAPIGELQFGRSDDDFDLHVDGPNGHIRSIKLTSDALSTGDWGAASIGTLSSRTIFEGDVLVEGVIPGTNLAIKTIRVTGISDTQIRAETGGIGSIVAREIFGSDLVAPFFGTITLTKGIGGDGDLLGSDVRALADNTAIPSIKTLTVAGRSEDSTIMTRSSVGDLTFGRFLDTVLFVGHLNPGSGAPVFGDLNDFDTTRSIKSLTVKQAFDLAIPALAQGVRITAGALPKVTINGFTPASNGGDPHGMIATSFGVIKMRSLTGQLFTVPPIQVGDNNPFQPTASDFVFRLVL